MEYAENGSIDERLNKVKQDKNNNKIPV